MLQKILDFITSILKQIVNFLPNSPFISVTDYIKTNEYLKYINWIIPFDTCVVIGQAWLTAIAIFYIYQVVLRWVKAIE